MAVVLAVPPVRLLAASAHDPLRGVTWVFGGQDATETTSAELWSFDGTTWARHAAAGPSARVLPALAFDPVRDQLVLFGGGVHNVSGGLIPTTTYCDAPETFATCPGDCTP